MVRAFPALLCCSWILVAACSEEIPSPLHDVSDLSASLDGQVFAWTSGSASATADTGDVALTIAAMRAERATEGYERVTALSATVSLDASALLDVEPGSALTIEGQAIRDRDGTWTFVRGAACAPAVRRAVLTYEGDFERPGPRTPSPQTVNGRLVLDERSLTALRGRLELRANATMPDRPIEALTLDGAFDVRLDERAVDASNSMRVERSGAPLLAEPLAARLDDEPARDFSVRPLRLFGFARSPAQEEANGRVWIDLTVDLDAGHTSYVLPSGDYRIAGTSSLEPSRVDADASRFDARADNSELVRGVRLRVREQGAATEPATQDWSGVLRIDESRLGGGTGTVQLTLAGYGEVTATFDVR